MSARRKHRPNIADVERAISLERAARTRVEEVMNAAHPVGSEIHWCTRGYVQCGTVIYVGGHESVRVRNDATGREYWIDYYFVREAANRDVARNAP